jgi:hypothetical protein
VVNDTESYSLPEHWSTVHARIGLNFVFGNKIEEKILPPM